MTPGLSIPTDQIIADDASRNPDARSLTLAMRRGDERAWSVFVERAFDYAVYSVMKFTGRDESFCHDAAQDAMLKAVKKPEVIDNHRALLSWTATLARTAAIDRIRSENRRRAREQSRSQEASSTDADYEGLFTAIAELDNEEQSVLLDRIARDKTLAQIAESHGLTVGAAHGRIRRTLEKLRSNLEGAKP